jgi:alpha-glucosidase
VRFVPALSGYTSINGKRYVFNWNYDKVPQPKVMSQAFHDAGLKLAANIKPCLLQDHPRYNEVAEKGLFIRDSETDAPERSSFWDDEGRTSTLPTRRRCSGGRTA